MFLHDVVICAPTRLIQLLSSAFSVGKSRSSRHFSISWQFQWWVMILKNSMIFPLKKSPCSKGLDVFTPKLLLPHCSSTAQDANRVHLGSLGHHPRGPGGLAGAVHGHGSHDAHSSCGDVQPQKNDIEFSMWIYLNWSQLNCLQMNCHKGNLLSHLNGCVVVSPERIRTICVWCGTTSSTPAMAAFPGACPPVPGLEMVALRGAETCVAMGPGITKAIPAVAAVARAIFDAEGMAAESSVLKSQSWGTKWSSVGWKSWAIFLMHLNSSWLPNFFRQQVDDPKKMAPSLRMLAIGQENPWPIGTLILAKVTDKSISNPTHSLSLTSDLQEALQDYNFETRVSFELSPVIWFARTWPETAQCGILID